MNEGTWQELKQTFIENWPNEIYSMSFPQVDIPLTIEEAQNLGSNIGEWYFMFDVPYGRNILQIEQKIDNAIKKVGGKAFIKLGSRSPKDTLLGLRQGYKCTNGKYALRLLTDVSERVATDLHQCISHNYAPHIFVRKWTKINPFEEFRCFVKNNELVGVSQYHYHKPYMAIYKKHINFFRDTIKLLFGTLNSNFPLSNYVWDVVIMLNSRSKLIEINPFDPLLTDPCLFDWNGGFNNEFRVVGKTYEL